MIGAVQSHASSIARDGYAILTGCFAAATVIAFGEEVEAALATATSESGRLSSRGVAYASRNVLSVFPAAADLWRVPELTSLLNTVLGLQFGLVRALYFDKPPERSWSLPWHRDQSIAVVDHLIPSSQFTNPTVKAGVPHVIAPENVLREMLTLRVHLDEVTDENGPLQVIPGSHLLGKESPQITDAPVTIFANPGDVLAMRPLLSHASGNSVEGTWRHRRILHFEFAASPDLPDGFRWHTFIAGNPAD